MWMARYLLQRLTEKYGIDIEYHCKPLGDTDWNGSGMHCNFSTQHMREVGGKDYFEALMKQFEKTLMSILRFMVRIIICDLPANTKQLRGISFPTALQIEAHLSVFLTPLLRTIIEAIWRTVAQIHRVARIR